MFRSKLGHKIISHFGNREGYPTVLRLYTEGFKFEQNEKY